MPTLETLCGHGYLPKELPPQFTSTTLGHFLAAGGAALPAPIEGCTRSADTSVHSLARFGVQRRSLGIPNPILYSQLAACVVQGWSTLQAGFSTSPFSKTKPADRPGPSRPFDRSDAFALRPFLRTKIRSTSRYLVTADISRFYHSLYTHSIPWALHTKAVAKQNRGMGLLGNRIDRLVRASQDQQSIGIPVGPDTSLVLAEVVLTQVDLLLSASGVTNVFRIIDDYEIGTRTLGEAERAISALQSSLSEYELHLNGLKTRIHELPLPLESPWASRIKAFTPAVDPTKHSAGLVEFFDLVFEQLRAFPEDAVVAFAVRCASNFALDRRAWDCYEALLMQCCQVEPASLRYVIPELNRLSVAGFRMDATRLEEVLNHAITRHAPLGHGSEVAWAISGLMNAGLPLSTEAAAAASTMPDSVVALCMLDARHRGLTPPGHNFPLYASHMTTEHLYGKEWLIAYEANIKGWLPSVGVADHVNADAGFASLKTAGVSFYDPAAIPMAPVAPPVALVADYEPLVSGM